MKGFGKFQKKHRNSISSKILLFFFMPILAVSLSSCGESSFADSEAGQRLEQEASAVQPQDLESKSEPESISENDESAAKEQPEEDFSPGELVRNLEPEFFADLPKYSGEPYAVINDNIPLFTTENLPAASFAFYSELDELGRCQGACACIGTDIMPTEERGSIGEIRPSGWHTVKYPEIIEGNYLYNRCHLIGYQLAGENANERNLITGTRYLNTVGMIPFEDLTADYVRNTGNHVLYRVTPVFQEDQLLAQGVLMEGWSVEDEGAGVCFHVFVYNVQPGIVIDYADGSSHSEDVTEPLESTDAKNGAAEPQAEERDYILNTNTKKFHDPDCSSVDDMAEKNKQFYTGNREDVIAMGYEPCKRCKP